jgi:hypothetical protein
MAGRLAPPRVQGDQLDLSVGAIVDVSKGAHADRRIQRHGAFVEEIKRPDVDRAAGQVDARGR